MGYGMVGQWYYKELPFLLKISVLVDSWAGFEDTPYLD